MQDSEKEEQLGNEAIAYRWIGGTIAHHSISVICKDHKIIPIEHKMALLKFANEVDVDLYISKSVITMTYNWSSCWLYSYDIERLIDQNKLTIEMIDAYMWLKEYTDVRSDCWNVTDTDFGPHSWDDVERTLHDDLKYKTDKLKEIESTRKVPLHSPCG